MRPHLALLSLLILAACGGPQATELYAGTEGLRIAFVPSAPPAQAYEGRVLPVKLLVHNVGTHDVPYEKMRFGFTTDPLYLSDGLIIAKPEQLDPTKEVLKGRSENYPPGEDRIYSVPASESFRVKEVFGLREEPTTTIGASVCYAYTTTMTSSVCIDTSGSEQNLREQPCQASDIADAKGQGAPVAVTSVALESIPVFDELSLQEAVQPHFTITIENMGSGRIIGPDTLEIEDACLLRDIPREQLGAVRLEAWLLSSKLECLPGEIVPLFDGIGEARCTVPANDLGQKAYLAKQNFLSVLTINVSYLYTSSISQELTIRRTGSVNADLPSLGYESGYVYENGQVVYNSAGQPMTKCEQYAQNPDSIEEGWEITSDYSCACQAEECVITSTKRSCIPNACPGSTWCCASKQKSTAEKTNVQAPEASTS